MTSAAGRGVPLVEVVRSGFAESVHRGSAVLLAADGSVLATAGDPWAAVFPRSCSKPAQAAGMVAAGLDLPDRLLALAAASHSGAAEHLAGVAEILAAAGLGVEHLQTPADLPLGPAEREAWLRSGWAPEPRAMNCSGKHAAMLATCVARGWPIDSYRDPGHPLQQALRAEAERLAGRARVGDRRGRLRRPGVGGVPGRAGPDLPGAAFSPRRESRRGGWSTPCVPSPSRSAAPVATRPG